MERETALNGWLVVDKPVGPTSAQVVGKLKWALRNGGHGKPKIGHGGTLDPLASGVLPIALGEATKLAGYLLNGPKAYRFTLAFGAATATDDAEGAIVATSDVRPDAAAIAAVLPAFTGPIRQRPPAYSALKVDGERAYALARAGEAVELAEREVTILQLTCESVEADAATFHVRCTKGTYVRSLARDLALALGSVGHVSALRRTEAGPFRLEQALSLDKCVEVVHGPAPEQALLPLTAGLDDIPVLTVDPQEAAALKQGRRILRPRVKPGQYIATLGPVPVALVEVLQGDVKVVRGFNLL
ncbi:tRNA pseudouridine(55) synthase TruB [Sandaracinobacteroides hominis]|uniref:tRNA pseudouridine(55) synthase TruB n=1 Tax=Sandaracinobacteroides hominis TaxID=2780086 RepID=UPI002E2AA559|nr:tRNA pseudouridine(55) synthase TruB [Sandaracinobacteroides hominis]